MEVRSSDDKIVGEVRNIVFGTKDRKDYAIVASGGFFTPGKDSIVVPIQSLKVSQGRESFFLSICKQAVKTVPLMPDQDYKWLSDKLARTERRHLSKQVNIARNLDETGSAVNPKGQERRAVTYKDQLEGNAQEREEVRAASEPAGTAC